MNEVVTKKFMKLGTVNIPIGTEIGGLPDEIVSELVSRALVDRKRQPEKKSKKGGE